MVIVDVDRSCVDMLSLEMGSFFEFSGLELLNSVFVQL